MFEFRDPKLERSAGLTAADRKWMDEIIQDVNEGWGEDDPSKPRGMKYVFLPPLTNDSVSKRVSCCRFKGSDDYLRSKVRPVEAFLLSYPF